MGGAITLASYYAQTGEMNITAVMCCIPAIVTIGGILTVNNTCDIEKDIPGGRKTFSICVGRSNAQKALRIALLCACALICVEVLIWFPKGIAAMAVMAAALITNGFVQKLFLHDLTADVRREAMGGILAAHKWIIGSFCAAMLLNILV